MTEPAPRSEQKDQSTSDVARREHEQAVAVLERLVANPRRTRL